MKIRNYTTDLVIFKCHNFFKTNDFHNFFIPSFPSVKNYMGNEIHEMSLLVKCVYTFYLVFYYHVMIYSEKEINTYIHVLIYIVPIL